MSEGRAPTATPTGKNEGATRLDLSELENLTEGRDGGSSLTSGLFVTSKSNGKDSTKQASMSLTLPAGRTKNNGAPPPRSDSRSKGPGESAAPSGHALLPMGLRPAPKVRGASDLESTRNLTGTQVNPAEDPPPRACPQKPRCCAPRRDAALGNARHVRAPAAGHRATRPGTAQDAVVGHTVA